MPPAAPVIEATRATRDVRILLLATGRSLVGWVDGGDRGPRPNFIDHLIDESEVYSITDQVIDETPTDRSPGTPAGAPSTAGNPPPTIGPREQQRLATRQAILDATVAALVDDGYGALTTRRIADRAGIAQSTLMHHFETREQLLVEAVSNLAVTMADRAVAEIGASPRRGVDHREAVLHQAWATLTSPEALAAAQLLGATWAEPELAAALRALELRIAQIVLETARTVFPAESSDPRFAVYIDSVFQTIRGLIMSIPTWGRDAVEARWTMIRPILLEASSLLLPPAD